MKDMNCISVELAERMHQLMAERYHLQMRSRNVKTAFARLL